MKTVFVSSVVLLLITLWWSAYGSGGQPPVPRGALRVLRTVDGEQQQALIRQMERHTHDQAYFLLYNPINLYAVNKAVHFVPYVNDVLHLVETSVTDEHGSVRKQKAAVRE